MLNESSILYNDLASILLSTDVTEETFKEKHSVIWNLSTWLLFAFILFFCGLLGMIFNYKNFLVTMMAVELMYLGAVSSFVLYGAVTHDTRGLIYGLLLVILAACESAIGLGILIVLYRFERTIAFSAYQHLGG
jgi:NADH-quinone oxidoreductase subunit K